MGVSVSWKLERVELWKPVSRRNKMTAKDRCVLKRLTEVIVDLEKKNHFSNNNPRDFISLIFVIKTKQASITI